MRIHVHSVKFVYGTQYKAQYNKQYFLDKFLDKLGTVHARGKHNSAM